MLPLFVPRDSTGEDFDASGKIADACSSQFHVDPGISRHHVYNGLDLQQFPAGPFRDLFQYWLGLKENGQIPETEAFDLLDIPHLVTNILVADCHDARIRFRYSGTNVNIETGLDLTGLYMDELSCVDDIRERAHICTETGEPFVVTDHAVTWTSKDFKSYSTLVVPLANAEHKIASLVYVLDYS